MHKIIPFILVSFLLGCNTSTKNEQQLQDRIDKLDKKLADAYKPGFGEFMSSIQTHHTKLWFAGQAQNWKLCNFEVHEMMEAFGNILKYEQEREESQRISMINPALDSINAAILQKDPVRFRNNYVLLTNTCNSCHQAVQFEFNVVKIPDMQPFSNQEFQVRTK